MKNIQREVSEFISQHNLHYAPEYQALELVSSVGEISKEIIKMSNYGKNEFLEYHKELDSEIGDALFSLIIIANKFDIDLGFILDQTLSKYKDRIDVKREMKGNDDLSQ
ncbi:MAG: MazG nucleotide pyrophosphohydrolase domain-containing protein [bacterium]